MPVRRLWYLLLILALLAGLFLTIAPPLLERSMNQVIGHEPYAISERARELHGTLEVADLHADTTLWNRDPLARAERGHVDLPRLREGNVALQVFTAVTKSPSGQNYETNASDARDNITALAIAQAWPPRTWNSLAERALYQAERLRSAAERSGGELEVLLDRRQLAGLRQRRAEGEKVVGGILGTEGSHALDGELDNIDILYAAGYRVMGLQHFFDNRLGGSLHGESGAGLSAFGRQAVDRMLARGVIIDVAHSSPQVVRDVLARSDRPVILSHTGFQGACDSPRNISDDLMREIAVAGGIIGVGYWKAAICDDSPAGIAAAIAYGIDLVGADHVALGSDFDGAVTTTLDSSELAAITQALLDAGVGEAAIRKVMGGNAMRFFGANLPAAGG